MILILTLFKLSPVFFNRTFLLTSENPLKKNMSEKKTDEKAVGLPFRLGNGVFSLAALLGSARLDRLKLVPWFL